ncbi:MAG: hypothetical protein F4Y49_10315 [Dehalococcoidia bacterium]|nr:hypothetical protein [Dehalococcoidia bacterium]
MATPEFGTLESVDLREAWPHEAHNFTPWLADNLDRLADAIGMPLEPEGTEVQVDQFSADIFARNPQDDSFVLIENRLEGSDHTHLGQILTYLAGLEARTVIWVARDFQEAHLSAIRWLNENTIDQFAFFAVQVMVARIADSPLAPIFNVVEQPNQWDRHIRSASQEKRSELTPLGQFRSEFWTYYAERYPHDGVRLGFADANPDYIVENTGLKVRRFLAQNQVGLWITTQKRATWEESDELLNPYLPALEKELHVNPKELTDDEFELWESTAHRTIFINTKDRKNWKEATDWLHKHLTIYLRILSEPVGDES